MTPDSPEPISRNILIVDDDPDTCHLLKLIFTRGGYETQAVNSGEEAIHWVESGNADLVVLDIMMPGMDGWEVLQRIRIHSEVPVLFLTAQNTGDQAAYALRSGAQDFVRKPVHPEELLARIEILFGMAGCADTHSRTKQREMSRLNRPTISVIIPTLNEVRNLPLVLPYLPLNWIDEVILVDGRSTNGTVEMASRLLPSTHVVLENRRGKGAALRAGYKAATGDILVVMDADGSHDPREIPRFITSLIEGADFVKGSRFTPGGGTTDMPRFRKFGNGTFVQMVNLLFGTSFTDLCYGFHAFWCYSLEAIDLSDVDGFEIDTAIYLRALKNRLRMTEVPSFEGYRFHGVGKLETIPDGVRVLKTILREWLLSFKNNPAPPYVGFRGGFPGPVRATALHRGEEIERSSLSVENK